MGVAGEDEDGMEGVGVCDSGGLVNPGSKSSRSWNEICLWPRHEHFSHPIHHSELSSLAITYVCCAK